jgi:hypothetical protein
VIVAHGGPDVGERAAEALAGAGIAAQRQESSGTPIGNVSSSNRWMEVCHSQDLTPVMTGAGPLKFLAASDEEAYRMLDVLAAQFGLPRDQITARPHGGYV